MRRVRVVVQWPYRVDELCESAGVRVGDNQRGLHRDSLRLHLAQRLDKLPESAGMCVDRDYTSSMHRHCIHLRFSHGRQLVQQSDRLLLGFCVVGLLRNTDRV
jgi:hypothetical protein